MMYADPGHVVNEERIETVDELRQQAIARSNARDRLRPASPSPAVDALQRAMDMAVPSSDPREERIAALEAELKRTSAALERVANILAATVKSQAEMRADLLKAGAFDKKSAIFIPGMN